ncbi:MAG: hypothetical protein ACI4WS_14565 [Oscillospiraceae bacterium]
MDFINMIARIEKLCQERGINKTTAYVHSGVGKDFGANIRKGNIPSAEKVRALADYLNCSTDYLLGKETETVTLSPKQQKVLDLYDSLSPEQQASFEQLLDSVLGLKK